MQLRKLLVVVELMSRFLWQLPPLLYLAHEGDGLLLMRVMASAAWPGGCDPAVVMPPGLLVQILDTVGYNNVVHRRAIDSGGATTHILLWTKYLDTADHRALSAAQATHSEQPGAHSVAVVESW